VGGGGDINCGFYLLALDRGMKSFLRVMIVVLVGQLISSAALATITIQSVPVGDLDNPNDPLTSNIYGAVNHDHYIGAYETTVGQYTAFLNAVAATDTEGLYNSEMTTDLNVAGIAQNGSPGNYSYSVIGSALHRTTYVSWGDAAHLQIGCKTDSQPERKTLIPPKTAPTRSTEQQSIRHSSRLLVIRAPGGSSQRPASGIRRRTISQRPKVATQMAIGSMGQGQTPLSIQINRPG
jgi:hypothetical protein